MTAGMSPIDVIVELKQNKALEYALFLNSKGQKRFDMNLAMNNKGYNALHRAVISCNYNAINLLLNNSDINSLHIDREFNYANYYCHKMLFLYKYIKKG